MADKDPWGRMPEQNRDRRSNSDRMRNDASRHGTAAAGAFERHAGLAVSRSGCGYSGGGYGSEWYSSSFQDYAHDCSERGMLGRTGDEVASWLGSDEAGRQRGRVMQDERGPGRWSYARSDDHIREDVCDRIIHDPRIDASLIVVGCYEGEITLSGTVDRREARRRAEDCAVQVAGVRHVQNDLRVQDHQDQGTADGTAGPGLAQAIEPEPGTATRAGHRRDRRNI